MFVHDVLFLTVNIRDLFVESYRTLRGQNLARFWKDVVADADIVQLLDEDFFRRQEETTATANPLVWSSRTCRTTANGSKSQSKMASGSDPESNQTDREIQSGSDHDPESKMDVELESRGEPSVIDPESSDGHLFARPLRNEKPVGIVIHFGLPPIFDWLT